MFSIRLVIIISCCLVYAYSQEIFKLATACSKKSLELDELMVLDNEDIISKDVTNSCKLLINNTRFYSNGFILRINLNSTIGPDSFSMNLTNNSNQLVYKFDKSFNITSPILIKVYTSLFFEINMKSSNQFEFIKSIVITSFNDTKNGSCSKDEFKCKLPSNSCINAKFQCYTTILPCSDDSFLSQNCDNQPKVIINKIESTTTTTTPTFSSNIELTTNSTINNTTESFNLIPKKKAYNFIGLIFFLAFVIIAALVGIVIYGRRKRKWREFLAQLDNNTDWEYEQLEDMPNSIGGNGGDRYMSTVFDRTLSTSESERENNNNKFAKASNNTEQTPINNTIN